MARSPFSYIRSGFSFFWRFLDAGRRTVLNLIFLALLIVILYAIFGGGLKPLAPKTTLVLDLKGQLVEQSSASPRDALLTGVQGGESVRMLQLRDVLKVLAPPPKMATASKISNARNSRFRTVRRPASSRRQKKAKPLRM